jgi:acetylornithine/succinyldiaminopimelate/putrescine aminotransferase
MERFEARMRSNNPIASPPADSQQASTHHPSTSQAATWNPELRRTLTLLGLDVHFHRAQGAYLYYRDSGGRERRVIDLISGYGSVLLGHHPPALIARARQFLDQGEAFFCQGSRPEATCELADELSRRCGGDFHVCFSSTGSGAVEIAIQHAILETGRHKIMALQGAFHGRTIGTGALSACVSSAYARGRFDVVRVPHDDPVAIAQAFSTHQSSEGPDGLAACIFEPILGEGGVRPLSAEVLETLQRGCRDQDIPLIADECQTGMGRTGSFLASTQAGCSPDYIILSKALGGGMAKVSACLIRRQRYRPEFDWQHTSTFAADPFSSAIALKALEALSESTLQRVRHAGREVLARLTELREQFPGVIADVRGAGLMLAVQLRRQALSQSLLMRIVNQHEIAGHAVAAYLFHQHQVRVAPTLSDPWTLRIHGTLETSREDWGRLLDGLEDVCSLLANQDMATLLQVATKKRTVESDRSIALGKSWIPFNRGDCLREEVTQRQHALKRVGWICHLIDDQDVADHDESFAMLPCAERERLLQSLLPLAKPIVMSAPVIQSTT